MNLLLFQFNNIIKLKGKLINESIDCKYFRYGINGATNGNKII